MLPDPAYAPDVTITDEDHAELAKLPQRAMMVAGACLAIVILVLTVALAIVVQVAATQVDVNNALKAELECRAEVSARVISAQGSVSSRIALTLVHLQRGEDLSVDADLIELAVAELQAATAANSSVSEVCPVSE